MSLEEVAGKAIEQLGGIATAIATALAVRYAAKRWPIPGEKPEPPRPKRRRRNRRHDDPKDDPELEEE